MPKDIIPKSRGLTPEEIGDPFPKFTPPTSVPKAQVSNEPTQVSEGRITKIIETGSGYSILEIDGIKTKLSNGTLSWRNNNPGNIKFGPFARAQGAIGEGHNDMAIFPTYEIGRKAQKTLLFGPESEYTDLTLIDAIKRYAPASDGNNPKEYANFVSKKAGIEKTTRLGKLSNAQQEKMMSVMFEMEGFKEGSKKKI